MFKLRREYKFAILLLASVCLDCVRISFIPFGVANYILCNCFILSELPHITQCFKSLKKTILSRLMIVMIIATVVLFINSPHYAGFTQMLRMVIMELFAKYFVICYAYLSINSKEKLKPALNVSYYGLLVLTGFAVLNYITKHAIFIDEMLKGVKLTDVMEDAGAMFTYADRFRVQAMFPNPFNYGYICIIILLFNSYGYLKLLIKKSRFVIVVLCCLFGVFTCGCRTNIFCLLIGGAFFVMFAFNLKKKMKYIVTAMIIGTIVYSSVPLVQEKMQEMTSIFDKQSSKVVGSSLEMRTFQYLAVLYHIRDNVLFGRGKDFFNIDMGWGEGKKYLVDKDLYGLEGVLMNHLLERGIIGVFFYSFFYLTLLTFAYKCNKYDKLASALCVAVLCTYLSFANMTGELNSVFSTLLITGVCIRLLNKEKEIAKIRDRCLSVNVK